MRDETRARDAAHLRARARARTSIATRARGDVRATASRSSGARGDVRARWSARASGMTAGEGNADTRADGADARARSADARETARAEVEETFGTFSIGADSGSGGRGRGGKSFRNPARGGDGRRRAERARGATTSGTESEGGGGGGAATWGAFAERLEAAHAGQGGVSPSKTFEFRAMPEKTPWRATASQASSESGDRPRVARSLEQELARDASSEPTSSPPSMTSPEPMAVDSPADSEASEAMRFTPPSATAFNMGAGGVTTSGGKKSASFRNRASNLRVEVRDEQIETPSSAQSDTSILEASPASPVFSALEPKQFTFNAPPPSKSPTRKKPPSAQNMGNDGEFKMGSDDAPQVGKVNRTLRYAQRAGFAGRRASNGSSGDSPKASVAEIEDAASKLTLAPRELEETEKLRQQGNALYGKGKYVEADEMYSRAIMVFAAAPRTNGKENKGDESPLGKQIDTFVGRDAAVLLTNRAAARMMIPTETTTDDEKRELLLKALTDCERAVRADPTYVRAQLRVVSCHMKLGSFEAAMQCLESSPSQEDADLENLKVEVKAAMENLSTVVGASLVLQGFKPGLPRLYSDSRARALDENSVPVVRGIAALANYPLLSSSDSGKAFIKAKATLFIACGAYEEASEFVAEIERLNMSNETWVPSFTFMAKFGKGDPLSAVQYAESVPNSDIDEELLTMARVMLDGKDEGNKHFNAQKYAEAVASYTRAFDAGKLPIAAAYCSVVLGNRAAAHQGLNEYLSALADCGRALSFNPWNIKALSRRATLHESIRCWEDAITDLRTYIEIAGNDQYNVFATPRERKDALALATDRLRRLETIKDTQRNSQVDMYRILGLEELKENATSADIKKAYRTLALKYHPDKANRNMPVWAPVSELHDDADRLFKLIGETNANLSDPALRRVYDESERIRSASDYSRFTRTNTWSSSNDFQFGQDAPWMSPRRSKSRVHREHSAGKNYYWNFSGTL